MRDTAVGHAIEGHAAGHAEVFSPVCSRAAAASAITASSVTFWMEAAKVAFPLRQRILRLSRRSSEQLANLLPIIRSPLRNRNNLIEGE